MCLKIGILIQMVKVGEETGSLGKILKTLSDFYKREVDDAVDAMISLIEPVMICCSFKINNYKCDECLRNRLLSNDTSFVDT